MKKPLTSFGRGKSKYYYDYTRNMSQEQINEFEKSKNLMETCKKESCGCCKGADKCPNKVCVCPKRKQKILDVFKDNNDYNEKSIVGFIAFLVMVLVMLADVISGWFGKDLIINEFIYDSFVLVVLGCFGIAGIEKFAKK